LFLFCYQILVLWWEVDADCLRGICSYLLAFCRSLSILRSVFLGVTDLILLFFIRLALVSEDSFLKHISETSNSYRKINHLVIFSRKCCQ
jgi:hypothetical protein